MSPALRRPESRYCLAWEAITCSLLLFVLSERVGDAVLTSATDELRQHCPAPGSLSHKPGEARA
jgi:hypothetical protein